MSIKLVESYAIQSLRNDVRDSLMMTGEQAILLQLFHPGDTDAQPCQVCGDDVYKSAEADCTTCYGTRFEHGVRQARKVWTLFSDHQITEAVAKTGTYQPDHREIQFEAFPLVTEHDMVVRVRQWGSAATPSELEGYYELEQVNRRSLRTGNRFGQWSWDVVAQKAQLSKLPANAPITRYPILGVSFDQPLVVTMASTSSTVVVQPDTRLVFFPSTNNLGDDVRKYAATIGDGTSQTITIFHNFGTRDVVVSLHDAATFAEVETDVIHADVNAVTLSFASPPAQNSLRAVITG